MVKMITEAVCHLRERDEIIRGIIDKVGPCSLAPSKDYFGSLIRTIVSQQLSSKAAGTIFSRLLSELNDEVTPARVLKLSPSRFIRAGISKQKKSYIVELAKRFETGEISTATFRERDDEDLIKCLEEIRGIGRWSAEMFLIFCLNRLNILPLDDVGFKRAVRVNYGLRKSPSERTLKRIAEQWEPYRSVAVWYLWQSIDGIG
jgi:DNA-3-methyladenine glycosylase II